MTKERADILERIRRTAEDGVPLGQDRFAQVAGVPETVWGRYWARFGDAQREAGFTPRTRTLAYPIDEVLAQVVALMRDLTEAYRRTMLAFPVPACAGNHNTELWDNAPELIKLNQERPPRWREVAGDYLEPLRNGFRFAPPNELPPSRRGR